MKRKTIKKFLAATIAVSAIVAFSLIYTNTAKADVGGGGASDCSRNGYKAWQNPGISGNYHFKDCWCSSQYGRNMIACTVTNN